MKKILYETALSVGLVLGAFGCESTSSNIPKRQISVEKQGDDITFIGQSGIMSYNPNSIDCQHRLYRSFKDKEGDHYSHVICFDEDERVTSSMHNGRSIIFVCGGDGKYETITEDCQSQTGSDRKVLNDWRKRLDYYKNMEHFFPEYKKHRKNPFVGLTLPQAEGELKVKYDRKVTGLIPGISFHDALHVSKGNLGNIKLLYAPRHHIGIKEICLDGTRINVEFDIDVSYDKNSSEIESKKPKFIKRDKHVICNNVESCTPYTGMAETFLNQRKGFLGIEVKLKDFAEKEMEKKTKL